MLRHFFGDDDDDIGGGFGERREEEGEDCELYSVDKFFSRFVRAEGVGITGRCEGLERKVDELSG